MQFSMAAVRRLIPIGIEVRIRGGKSRMLSRLRPPQARALHGHEGHLKGAVCSSLLAKTIPHFRSIFHACVLRVACVLNCVHMSTSSLIPNCYKIPVIQSPATFTVVAILTTDITGQTHMHGSEPMPSAALHCADALHFFVGGGPPAAAAASGTDFFCFLGADTGAAAPPPPLRPCFCLLLLAWSKRCLLLLVCSRRLRSSAAWWKD